MLTEPDLFAIEYICLNLRESDQTEIFNVRPHDSALQLAWESFSAVKNLGRGRIGWANGRPAALAAFTEDWPGCWQVWMFGTKDFRAAAVPLLRWFRKEANDILTVCEGRRLQCDCRLGHEDAHKMIKALGGKPEGPPMAEYGKDGGAYQRYVWLRKRDAGVLDPGYVRAA